MLHDLHLCKIIWNIYITYLHWAQIYGKCRNDFPCHGCILLQPLSPVRFKCYMFLRIQISKKVTTHSWSTLGGNSPTQLWKDFLETAWQEVDRTLLGSLAVHIKQTHVYVYLHTRQYVTTQIIWSYIYVYIISNVCMHVCMYVCMYVCIYKYNHCVSTRTYLIIWPSMIRRCVPMEVDPLDFFGALSD